MCAVLLFLFYFFTSTVNVYLKYYLNMHGKLQLLLSIKKKCAEVRRVSRDQVYIIFCLDSGCVAQSVLRLTHSQRY